MRLFVAFLLTDEVRMALRSVQRSLTRFDRDVRWAPVEQMHVTVQFLGEVADGDVQGIGQALVDAGRRGAAFRMEVAGCGCFPPRGPVRIVWVGANDETGSMNELVDAVHSELERAGVPRETRPWTGHITVGRVRADATGGKLREAVAACSANPAVRQPVDAIALMSSVLTPKGARYSVVQTISLGADKDGPRSA